MNFPADRVEVSIDFKCRCGTPIVIPLKRDWSSPLYVMHMEWEHKILREALLSMQKDFLELAGECVDAGVQPEILQRADRLRDQFRELKRRFDME